MKTNSKRLFFISTITLCACILAYLVLTPQNKNGDPLLGFSDLPASDGDQELLNKVPPPPEMTPEQEAMLEQILFEETQPKPEVPLYNKENGTYRERHEIEPPIDPSTFEIITYTEITSGSYVDTRSGYAKDSLGYIINGERLEIEGFRPLTKIFYIANEHVYTSSPIYQGNQLTSLNPNTIRSVKIDGRYHVITDGVHVYNADGRIFIPTPDISKLHMIDVETLTDGTYMWGCSDQWENIYSEFPCPVDYGGQLVK